MFWKRWKEGDPLPRGLRSARWRSILVVLLCAGFFAFSYYMTHARLVPETSPEQDFWTGVFWMVISGICFVAFLPSVFLPTSITMDSEGFSVRSVWRGEQRYRWKDISYFDIINLKYPHIIWVNKVDDGNWRRRWYYYDHKLPSAMWTHRIKDIFAILSCWLDNHNERQDRRR